MLAPDRKSEGDSGGLELSPNCPGAFAIVDDPSGACSHGVDRHGVDGESSAETPSQLQGFAEGSIRCDTSNGDRNRVEVIYARPAGAADRSVAVRDQIARIAGGVDVALEASAAAAGGNRSVRWLTDSGCRLIVRSVVLPAGAEQSYASTLSALRKQGFNRTDRRYLVFVDADVLCGIAGIHNDDRPSATQNYNNTGGPLFARLDRGCWSVGVAAHELLHTFGAHQPAAPMSDGSFHCTERGDVMCAGFESAAGGCAGMVIDCGNDAYFNPSPAPGSYLSTHWNAADSSFLFDPDRSVVVSVKAPRYASAGHNFSQIIDVSNPGSVTANGIKVVVTLPTEVRLDRVTSPDASCSQTAVGTYGARVTCTWAAGIAAGSSASVRLGVTMSPLAFSGDRAVSKIAASRAGEPSAGTTTSVTIAKSLVPGTLR